MTQDLQQQYDNLAGSLWYEMEYGGDNPDIRDEIMDKIIDLFISTKTVYYTPKESWQLDEIDHNLKEEHIEKMYKEGVSLEQLRKLPINVDRILFDG